MSNNAPRDLYRINENLGTARPASTFKVLLCALLEEQGVDTTALHYDCDGAYTLRDGTVVHCAEQKAHGAKLSTEDALGVSCNCFFAQAIEEHPDWAQAETLLREMGFVVNGEGEGERHLGRLERDASRITLGEDASSDLCWEQLTGLGLTALDLAQSEGEEWFVTGSVPAQGQYLDEKRDGMAVLVPKDWETLQEELHRMLYG